MFRCKYLQELNKKVFRSELGYLEELSVWCLGASTCRSSIRRCSEMSQVSRGAECLVFRCKYLQKLNKKVFRTESGYQEELSVGFSGASTCRS